MKTKTKFKQTEIGMIPEDWEVDKLENHLIIKGRIGWKGLQISEYTDVGPFIVGGLQIKENNIVWEECAHVTEGRYKESPEIMLRESDILMTKDGTIGKLAYIKSLPNKVTVASHIHVIRKNSDKILPHFLFYFFKSPRFQNLIESKISGSVVPALIQKDINSTEFPLPPIPEQQHIAKILSDLDSKIELNQQMNKILEEIGQAIFKHWFIDFEFPNTEGKPYKSSGGEMIDSELGKIPKGWNIGEFNEIIHLTMGLSPRGESYNVIKEGIPLINGAADFSDGKIIPKKFTTQPTRVCKKNDLLLCIRGTIGNLTYADGVYCLGRGVAAIAPTNEMYKEYAYFILHNKLNVMISKAAGSVIVGLSKPDILNLKILLPQENIMKIFHTQLESLFAKQELFKSECDNLSKIRDSLLPKLMSGKIRVPVQVN